MDHPQGQSQLYDFSGNVIILEHALSVYGYDPSLSLYRIDDKRLSDLSTYFNLRTFMSIFNEQFELALKSQKPVFTIKYSSLMARTIKICLDKYFSPILDYWHVITFFHNDTVTKQLPHCESANPLDDKMFILETLLDFPYIKKIELPYNASITAPYLAELIQGNK